MSSLLMEKTTNLEVCDWLEANVLFSLLAEISYKTLYSDYEKWCLKAGIVPNTRASFSRELRKELKERVDTKTIRIINNKGIIIKGLSLKNINYSSL